jgi:hypothetical protein
LSIKAASGAAGVTRRLLLLLRQKHGPTSFGCFRPSPLPLFSLSLSSKTTQTPNRKETTWENKQKTGT